MLATAAADPHRAHINYLIHCQGCHLPEGVGHPGKVPRMKNYLGWFTHSADGRRYLTQVPGVAASVLSDADIAELLNWLLTTYSTDQLPPDFAPYSRDEIAATRGDQERDPETRRRSVLLDIADRDPALREAIEAEPYLHTAAH